MTTETVPKKVLITFSPLPSELEEGERVEDSELEPPKPSISHHKKKKKKKNSKNPLPPPPPAHEKEENDEELDWEKEGDKSTPSLSEFTIKKASNDARPSSSKRLAVNDGKGTPSKKAKVKEVVPRRLWTHAKVFHRSQKVWGKGKRVADEEDIEEMYPHLCHSFDDKVASAGVLKYLFETLSLMDRSKAKELDEEWMKLDEMEAKVLIKKTLLMSKQMKLLCR